MLMLEPDFMWYQNGGSSTYPESWYSFSASLNGESLGSGARTNSGGFKWSAELGSGWMGDDRANAFELSAKHMVKDGELDTFAKSPTISTTESISAVDAVYMESIASGREQFSLKGYGRTSADTRERSKPSTDPSPQVIDPLPAYIKLTGQVQYLEVGPIPSTTNQVDQLLPVGSQSTGTNSEQLSAADRGSNPVVTSSSTASSGISLSDIKGFSQMITVSGKGTDGYIDTKIYVDSSAIWTAGVKSDEEKFVFGMGTEGTSLSGTSMLKMEGAAASIPKQILPPGSVEVKKSPVPSGPDYYETLVNEKINEFYSEYPTSSGIKPPTAYYQMENQASLLSIPATSTTNSVSGGSSGDYFLMNMGFTSFIGGVLFR
ncbi:MAG: hypothetical protein QFX31_04480 [Methanothrix sp.]|uniref:hypothetical protein n=1 Tax=Methanothrix sp. TaxID=90426 RepID=UPI0032AEEF2E|nr:hypothetical protein [Methanothrix sp.]